MQHDIKLRDNVGTRKYPISQCCRDNSASSLISRPQITAGCCLRYQMDVPSPLVRHATHHVGIDVCF